MQLKELAGDWTFTAFTPGQATAGTEDDWVALVAPYDMTVTGVKWTPNAAITANATNYFDLQILNGATAVATRSYAATNSVALTSEEMTLSATAADLLVDAGDVLVIHKETTAGGSGLAMPDGHVQISAKLR
jgi:hypothetical protein